MCKKKARQYSKEKARIKANKGSEEGRGQLRRSRVWDPRQETVQRALDLNSADLGLTLASAYLLNNVGQLLNLSEPFSSKAWPEGKL